MNVHYSIDEWKDIFNQRIQSGLSIRNWCELNGLKYDTYKYWEKKVKDLESTESPAPAFVELPANSYPMDGLEAPSMQIRYREFQVGIQNTASLSRLAEVLRLLRSLC